MKKILAVFFSLFLLFLGGCGWGVIMVDSSETEQQTDIVLNAFKTGETEELKKLFCKKIAENCDLDTQLKEAISFLDGNIIEDGRRHGMSEAGNVYKEGVKVDSHIRPYIEKIKTDSNKYYTISFSSYLIYNDDPDYVGMTLLSVYETDKKGHLTENCYIISEAGV